MKVAIPINLHQFVDSLLNLCYLVIESTILFINYISVACGEQFHDNVKLLGHEMAL